MEDACAPSLPGGHDSLSKSDEAVTKVLRYAARWHASACSRSCALAGGQKAVGGLVQHVARVKRSLVSACVCARREELMKEVDGRRELDMFL